MSLGFIGANVLSLLTDDAIIAGWNNEGLPSDAMSTENAVILMIIDLVDCIFGWFTLLH